jgi:nucleoside-diphosphate-sugar epimerase
MSFLITGSAGFIGYHVAARLLEAGERVIGIDNLEHRRIEWNRTVGIPARDEV